MILVLAYCAVLLSFASGLLAQMMNQRHNLSALGQYLSRFHALRGNEIKPLSGECKNPPLQPPSRAGRTKDETMILKRQTNWIGSVIMMMALMVGAHVQATSDFQIWVPININAKLTEQLRGFLELQPRIGNNASNLTTAIVRPSLGWAINEQATLWVGYLMQADSVTPDSDRYGIENRAWQGFTWRDTANEKQFIWEIRNRLEERFLAGNSDPSIRWRTRFRVEQLIPDGAHWSVIASEEIFVNLNDNSNNAQLQAGAQQNRLYAGVGYRFTPEAQVETGYLYQHVWRNSPSADQNNNVWMTNLNLNF